MSELYKIQLTNNHTGESLWSDRTPENFEGVKIQQKFSLKIPIGYTRSVSLDTARWVGNGRDFLRAAWDARNAYADVDAEIWYLNADGLTYNRIATFAVDFMGGFVVTDDFVECGFIQRLNQYRRLEKQEIEIEESSQPLRLIDFASFDNLRTVELDFGNHITGSMRVIDCISAEGDVTGRFAYALNGAFFSYFCNEGPDLYQTFNLRGVLSGRDGLSIGVGSELRLYRGNPATSHVYDTLATNSDGYPHWQIGGGSGGKDIEIRVRKPHENDMKDSYYLVITNYSGIIPGASISFTYLRFKPKTKEYKNVNIQRIRLSDTMDAVFGAGNWQVPSDAFSLTSNALSIGLSDTLTIKPSEFIADLQRYTGWIMNEGADGVYRFQRWQQFIGGLANLDIDIYKDIERQHNSDLILSSIIAGKTGENYKLLPIWGNDYTQQLTFDDGNGGDADSFTIMPSKFSADFWGVLENYIQSLQKDFSPSNRMYFLEHKPYSVDGEIVGGELYAESTALAEASPFAFNLNFTPKRIIYNWLGFLNSVFFRQGFGEVQNYNLTASEDNPFSLNSRVVAPVSDGGAQPVGILIDEHADLELWRLNRVFTPIIVKAKIVSPPLTDYSSRIVTLPGAGENGADLTGFVLDVTTRNELNSMDITIMLI